MLHFWINCLNHSLSKSLFTIRFTNILHSLRRSQDLKVNLLTIMAKSDIRFIKALIQKLVHLTLIIQILLKVYTALG